MHRDLKHGNGRVKMLLAENCMINERKMEENIPLLIGTGLNREWIQDKEL